MLNNQDIQAYQKTLQRITLIGSLFGALFMLFFALSYLSTGFLLAMWINLIAAFISLVSFFIMLRDTNRYKSCGYLLAFAVYFSNLFTSIVMSSSIAVTVNWFTFIILMATLTGGVRGGIVWGVINILTVIALVVQRSLPGLEIQPIYEIADIVLPLVAVAIAVIFNEQIKQKALNKTEALQNEMRHLATIDDLTNTFNRRHFYAHMQEAMMQAQKTKQPLSLVLFDLDHFKQINDNYGHTIGDQVLTAVVKRCQGSIREGDILWRYGGEEFIILMPDTPLKTAQRIAERLCGIVQRDAIRTDAGFIPVTISLGVAAVPEGEEITITTLLDHVDEAMYAAKQSGRNQVMKWH
ncbi:MAG: diguanylate cyclase [Anaerolineales bacterium]|nr:diguanylate cyclase [Anaerolineales bacterium]